MTNKQIIEHSNGNGNGNGNGKQPVATQAKDLTTVWVPPEPVASKLPLFTPGDQPVLLERPSWWSHAFVWLIVGVTASGLLWAAVAPIEQAIPGVGKLETQGAAREVKAPNGGVVRQILVKDGDRVKQGQLLLILDPTAPQADLDSLKKTRQTLLDENKFYTANADGKIIVSNSEFASLIKLRSDLISETQFLQALSNNSLVPGASRGEFNANQQKLLEATRNETRSREKSAELQIQAYKEQLRQAQAQLEAAEDQLPKDKERLRNAQDQRRAALERFLIAQAQLPKTREREAMAKALVDTDQAILDKIEPVVKAGALSELQYRRQVQQILTRRNDLSSRQAEVLTAQNEISSRKDEITKSDADIATRESEIMNREADIKRFGAESERLLVAINQAQQQWQNAQALSKKDTSTKIADNLKRISDIDSQLGRIKLDNQKKLVDIEGQIQKAEQALQYQELRAPSDGIVFNLKPNSPGYVVRPSDAEPVLKIVPNENLVAAVDITNKDIGHVKEGMDVDVKVESFPSTEFGTLKGKLISLGSDVLPPTQERPFYAFPAKVALERSSFTVNGRDIPLQSGMAVQATIKVRKRTVLSIFTELFQKEKDSLKTVR